METATAGSRVAPDARPLPLVKNALKTSRAFKINCAVNALPRFRCLPSSGPGPGPEHRGTVHFEATMEEIHQAYSEAVRGVPARRPVVEMTIPSSLDDSLAPPGQHVVQLFVQYAPYDVDPAVRKSK